MEREGDPKIDLVLESRDATCNNRYNSVGIAFGSEQGDETAERIAHDVGSVNIEIIQDFDDGFNHVIDFAADRGQRVFLHNYTEVLLDQHVFYRFPYEPTAKIPDTRSTGNRLFGDGVYLTLCVEDLARLNDAPSGDNVAVTIDSSF